MRPAPALIVLSLLAACNDGAGLDWQVRGDRIEGRYPTSDWTADQIEAVIASSCVGVVLDDYSETPQGDMVRFTATCPDGVARDVMRPAR